MFAQVGCVEMAPRRVVIPATAAASPAVSLLRHRQQKTTLFYSIPSSPHFSLLPRRVPSPYGAGRV